MDSIKIKGDFDAQDIKKEIKALDSEINKLGKKQIPLISEFEELQHKAAQAKKTIADADKQLASGGIDKVDHFTIKKEATASLESYTAKIEELRNKIESLDNQIMPLQEQLESLKFTGSPDNSLAEVGTQAKANLEQAANAADKMSKELADAHNQSDKLDNSIKKVEKSSDSAASGLKSKMSSSLKSVEGSFKNFGKRISNTLKSALIFSVLYKGLSELKQRISDMLSTNEQFTSSLNQIKGNLAVAFQPIYQIAMPAINALLNLLVKATAYIAAFTNALFGTSVQSSITAANEMQSAINATKSGAKGASAAEKQLTSAIKEKQKQVKALQRENKQLQREYEQQKKAVEAQTDALEKQIEAYEKSIDSVREMEKAANEAAKAQRDAIQAKIEMLEKQQKALQKRNEARQESIDKQIKNLQSQQSSLQNKYDDENKAIDKQVKAFQNEIKVIQKAQKAAQEAEKANQKFTASFDELSTLGTIDEADSYDIEIDKIQEKIDALQQEKEVNAEAYEVQRNAIQDKINALQEEKEAINESYEAQNTKIQEQIELLQESQNAIKDADYSSSIAAYESKIAAIQEKITALNESVVENPLIEQNELLIEKLQEEIDLLQEQKDELQELSDAAAGVDSSAIKDLGVNLEELNEQIEKSKLLTWLQENGDKLLDFITIIAELSAIIGIVCGAFKGFSGLLALLTSPTGIIAVAIIAIAGFITVFGDTEAALDSLERMLNGFSSFLKGTFTGDIELAVEGLKDIFGGFGDFVMVVVEAIENCLVSFAKWIVKIEEEIFGIELSPDLKSIVNESGGYKYNSSGASIPQFPPKTWRSSAEFENSIPALAQGTVLPPNKPFLAMVGDQKHGTNVEAPLSTIEDALRNVMSEQNFNFNVSADGSMGALIRMLKLRFEREDIRSTAF